MLDRQGAGSWNGESGAAAARAHGISEPLTRRDGEMMEALASGMSHAALARGLGISTNTLKYHLRNIYAKLGVCSGLQALRAWSGQHSRA